MRFVPRDVNGVTDLKRLLIRVGSDGQFTFQDNEYLGVGMVMFRRCMLRRFDEVLDRNIRLGADLYPVQVFLRLVTLPAF